MIFRHQHVFGSARADTADEVLDLWQKVKKAERHKRRRQRCCAPSPGACRR